MAHREFKDRLYAQFARIGHALGSPKRLELLDLLAQGEKTVEQLAEESAMSIKNTSAHLRALREARLVETRRDGTFINYRLADERVGTLVRSVQEVGHRQLAEVEHVTRLYLHDRDELEPVTLSELQRLMRDDRVTVIDVRPREEYEAGHIPGAISIPLAEIKRRSAELPKRREVIAYCRGPYCVYSLEAVTLLRQRGLRARRADQGLPDWRARGWPIALGSQTTPPRRLGRTAPDHKKRA
jgi:rhodanese-related sulfurtransferase